MYEKRKAAALELEKCVHTVLPNSMTCYKCDHAGKYEKVISRVTSVALARSWTNSWICSVILQIHYMFATVVSSA